ncbi:hypothetical protein MLC52_10865 [Sulfurimonas sp. NW15]|uniref:hypothetical protein n=1 Tax=Sulfurimonas sp. NW15 TaxID=2922729 RepID=UPI003DA99507
MNKISKYKTLELIKNNPYFKCSFIKKDNSLRHMICSFEMNQKVDNSLVLVWDLENDNYRNINLDTLQTLTIKDISYKIV